MLSHAFIKSKYLWLPLLALYALLHVAKLELYPLCLFGMYSMPLEKAVEDYSIYTIEVEEQILDYKDLPYKKFLMLNNSLRKYDQTIHNDNIDPASFTLRKTMQRIPGSFLDQRLERPYHYRDTEQQLLDWLHRFLFIDSSERIVVKRVDYTAVAENHFSEIGTKIIAGE